MSSIKLKRSSIQGRVPTTSNLELGEIAINTYDGKIFIKKDQSGTGGTETIVDLTDSVTLGGFAASDFLRSNLNDEATGLLTLTGGAHFGTANASFADNVSITLGDSQDLQIYHSGSHSYITDAGTGNLYIQGANAIVLENTNGHNYLYGSAGGEVTLYHNNSAKLSTTSTGVTITGTTTTDDLVVDDSITANTATITTVSTDEANITNWIDFGTSIGHPAHQEGRFWYDNIHKTFNYYNDNPDHAHELGVEEHHRVYNNSGATIPAGTPVYWSGNFNDVPTVAPGDATDETKYNVQGLTPTDIPNNDYGYVTVSGLVEGINTSGLSAGQNVFLGLTPGALQNASPVYPNYPMCIGWVVKSDATSGIILVNQQNHSVNSFRVRTSAHIGDDLTVSGDLIVYGSTTTTAQANISTGASFMYLNSGDTIGEGGTTFTGTGLDDAYFAGYFTGTSNKTFYVRIDATGTPDTFEWSYDNFVTTEATGVAITGAAQLLGDGISIDFGATTGHTVGDVWEGTGAPLNVDSGLWSNRNTGTSGVGYTHMGMYFDVSDQKFKFVEEYDPEPQGAINTSDASFSLATVVADIFEGTASNATLLDGLDSTQFLRSDVNDSFGGDTLQFTSASTSPKINITGQGGANSYNYLLRGTNDTGSSIAVHFVNGSTRTADGGGNAYTIRNDGGRLVLGGSGNQTEVKGSNIYMSANVGINDNSPLDKLSVAHNATSVYSSSAIPPGMRLTNHTTGDTLDQAVGIQFQATSLSGTTTGVAGISAVQYNKQSSADLVFQNRNAGTISETMRIRYQGYVGVNTANPEAQFHVNGGNVAQSQEILRISAAATGGPFFWASSSINSSQAAGENFIHIIGKAETAKNSGYIGYKWNSAAGNDNLLTFGHYASDNLMNLTADGKLGIRTQTPSEALHVYEGSILIQKSASTTAVSELKFKNAFDTGYLKSSYTNPSASTETYVAFHANTAGATNGTVAEQMRIAGNKVGIGTSTPGSKLEIYDAPSAIGTGNVVLNSSLTTGATRLGFKEQGSMVGQIAYSHGNDQLEFIAVEGGGKFVWFGGTSTASVSQRMLLDTSGNLMVGSSTPTTRLHAYDSTADSTTTGRTTPIDILTLESQNTATQEYAGFGQGIVFKGSTYNSQVQRTLGRILHQINDDSLNTTRGTSMSFQTLDDATTTSAPTTKLHINYDGNVGVGTETPTANLTVSNNGESVVRIQNTGGSGVSKLVMYPAGRDGGNGAWIQSKAAGIGNNYDVSLQLGDDAGTIMTLEAGKVGIGTEVPEAPLHIYGTAQTLLLGVTTYTDQYMRFRTQSDGIDFGLKTGIGSGGSGVIKTGNQKGFGVSTGNSNLAFGSISNSDMDFFVTSTGEVGIGLTTPLRKFVVYENSSGQVQTQYQNSTTGTTATDGFGVGIDANEKGFLWSYDSTDIYMGTSTAGTAVTINGTTGGVTIAGDLTVNGTTTTVNATNLDITDAVLTLNKGQATPSNDTGLLLQRYSSPTSANYNVALVWEETNDKFHIGTTTETGSDNDITMDTSWLTINSSGWIGVGTETPLRQMHVVADTSGASNYDEVMVLEGTGGYGAGLSLDAQASTGGDRWHLISTGTSSTPGAGKLGFFSQTSGDYKLILRNNGRLGLGSNNNPQYALDINNGNDDGIVLTNADGNNNNGIAFITGSGSSWMDITEGTIFRIKGTSYASLGNWNSGANVKFAIDASSNVGIATDSPSSYKNTNSTYFGWDASGKLLTIDGGNDGAFINLQANATVNGDQVGGLFFTDKGGQSDAHRQVAGIDAVTEVTGSTALDGAHLRFFTKPGNTALSSSSPRMIIRSSGYVGVNTSSPTGQFTVNGGDESVHVNLSNTQRLTIGADGTWNWFKGKSGNGHYFNTTGGGILVMKNDGDVGIGTSVPSVKLHVNDLGEADGTASRTAMFVNTTAAATSSYMYIGASSGTDWQIGKNVLGTSARTNFDITDHVGNLALSINSNREVLIGTTVSDVAYERLVIGENVNSDNVDYGITIRRHGTGTVPGTFTVDRGAIDVTDLTGQGPASYVQKGALINATYGRMVTGDTGTANGALIDISYDSGLSPLRLDLRGNMFLGHNRSGSVTSSETHSLYLNGYFVAGTDTRYSIGGDHKLTISATNIMSAGPSSGDMFYIRQNGVAGQYCWQTYTGASNAGEIQLQPYGGNVILGGTNISLEKLHVVGKTYLEGGAANWNTTTPGTARGTLHLDPGVATDNYGAAITFGASDTANGETAQAGIYTRTDGNYGSQMFLSTTDNYTSGSKSRLSIDHLGRVKIGSGVSSGAILDLETVGNTSDGTYYSTFTINNTGTSTWSRIRFDRSGVAKWGISLGTDDKFKISNLYTNGTAANPDDTVFVVDNASRIGIGQVSPTAKLDVAGDVRVDSGYNLDGNQGTSSATVTVFTLFAHASFGAAKLIVTAKNGNDRQVTELLITHDGTTAIATEYGMVMTNGVIASYDVAINGTDVELTATSSTSSGIVYNIVKTLID